MTNRCVVLSKELKVGDCYALVLKFILNLIKKGAIKLISLKSSQVFASGNMS